MTPAVGAGATEAVLPFGPVPLTPVHFLDRSAAVFADRSAYVDDRVQIDYATLLERAERLAGALRQLGVETGDRVSVLAPNTLLLLEAHFGVPLAGAVLNALNTRLGVEELSYIVEHAGSKVLLVDHSFAVVGEQLVRRTASLRAVVAGGPDDPYEALLGEAQRWRQPVSDEWALLSINYTSGTTGRPKGVMYAHRGAYLQALAMVAHSRLDPSSVFLWTLPMFHCNGWCFPWAVTAAGGLHIGVPKVDPVKIWAAIRDQGVTHFNAAPTVLASLAYGSWADDGPAPRKVHVGTGGAPPSPTLLRRLAELDIEVTHLYGLTETYGPAAICEWRPEWENLPGEEQARRRAWQGVGNLVSEPLRVVDRAGIDTPADGSTIGEVLLRGDNVMLGYYCDPAATAAAELGGWFRTGDVGVLHPEGYIELRDRAKDVIISGGENISSIEVEQAISAHPAVLECAVVSAPDERWGEVPVAFVERHDGRTVSADELIDYVRGRLAHFKAPKRVFFEPLPKTATGKIQKFELRERLWQAESRRIG